MKHQQSIRFHDGSGQGQPTAEFLKTRKMLLVLPLLVIPFITMAFWALGGGKNTASATPASGNNGLNTSLPGAKLKEEKGQSKLGFYEMAAKDSAKSFTNMGPVPRSMAMPGDSTANAGAAGFEDPNEVLIRKKLAAINRAVNSNTAPLRPAPAMTAPASDPSVERLEKMMQAMNSTDGNDPEMQQLNKTLEKIMDIQHPALAEEKIRQASLRHKGTAYPASAGKEPDVVDLVTAAAADTSKDTIRQVFTVSKLPRSNGFLSLDDPIDSGGNENAIAARVTETQTLVSNAVIRLELSEDMYVSGQLIPKGSLINGVCELRDERLCISVAAVTFRQSILPVSLSAFDLDGLEGLYIPGAITKDAISQGTSNAVQSLQLMSVDPSVTAQAASAGIAAAKDLFNKKAKLIRVTVKAGYQLLLHDSKPNPSQP